ncbi:MAG TPA: hypothetical protein VJR05_07850 [Acidimicrobiia bacterium]|nr:hypothetical protein [Acidimicrobiia bacterium]
MRLLFKLAAAVLAGLVAFVVLGPMAPPGSFISDAALGLREVFNAWWGFPFGLPSN